VPTSSDASPVNGRTGGGATTCGHGLRNGIKPLVRVIRIVHTNRDEQESRVMDRSWCGPVRTRPGKDQWPSFGLTLLYKVICVNALDAW
jgi:hypothetical protein